MQQSAESEIDQADDLDLGPLEGADDLEQLADPVLQEDRELGDRRPVAALQRLEVDLAAAYPHRSSWILVFPGLDRGPSKNDLT